MDTLEHVIEISHLIASLRRHRGELEEQIASLDEQLAEALADLKKYVPSVTSSNGNGTPATAEEPKKPRRARRGTGYIQGSVAHRILLALDTIEGGLSGADLTAATGVENKQIHALLTRMVPAGHIRREAKPGDERGSLHFITEAGRAALANSREGGSSDDTSSTAKND
jgi:hypothetical protein